MSFRRIISQFSLKKGTRREKEENERKEEEKGEEEGGEGGGEEEGEEGGEGEGAPFSPSSSSFLPSFHFSSFFSSCPLLRAKLA